MLRTRLWGASCPLNWYVCVCMRVVLSCHISSTVYCVVLFVVPFQLVFVCVCVCAWCVCVCVCVCVSVLCPFIGMCVHVWFCCVVSCGQVRTLVCVMCCIVCLLCVVCCMLCAV